MPSALRPSPTTVGRSLRHPGLFALTLLTAVTLTPRAATAQSSINVGRCVLGVFQTCTDVLLSTLGVVGGTEATIRVRQVTTSPRATGLTALTFGFARGSGGDPAASAVSMLSALRGAPAVADPPRWLGQGSANQLDLYHELFIPGPPAVATQYIGGCAGGTFSGDVVSTPLLTCLPGAWYEFRFTTAAVLEADDLTGWGFSLYAGTDDDAPMGRDVTCTFGSSAQLVDGCIDFANLLDPIVPTQPFPPGTVVPEPATLALTAFGFALLLFAARRSTRRAPSPLPTA